MRELGEGFRPGSKIRNARAFEIWALEWNESVEEKIRCLLLFIASEKGEMPPPLRRKNHHVSADRAVMAILGETTD